MKNRTLIFVQIRRKTVGIRVHTIIVNFRSYRWFSRYVIAAMLVNEKERRSISFFCSSTSIYITPMSPQDIDCRPPTLSGYIYSGKQKKKEKRLHTNRTQFPRGKSGAQKYCARFILSEVSSTKGHEVLPQPDVIC